MRKINQDSGAVSPEVFAERMFGNTDGNIIEQFRNRYAEESQARLPCKDLKPADAINFVTATEVGAIGVSGEDHKQDISLDIEYDLSPISAVKTDKEKSFNDKQSAERQTKGEPSRLMTVKDVAAYLSVSISKVWRLVKYEVDFPKPVRISGSTRWDRYSIDTYLDRLQTTAHSGI